MLNTTDPSPADPFDFDAFRGDVRRINSRAERFEVGALSGRGVDRWIDRVTRRMDKGSGSGDVSH